MRRSQIDEGVDVVVCRTTQRTGPGALAPIFLPQLLLNFPQHRQIDETV
jgi:hypothetical protein